MKIFNHAGRFIFIALLLSLLSACDFSGEETAKAEAKARTLLTETGYTDIQFVRGGPVVQEASMICDDRGIKTIQCFLIISRSSLRSMA